MAVKKVVSIIVIAVLALSILGGCRAKGQGTYVETEESEKVSEQEESPKKQVKEAATLQDLFYYKENFSAFAEEGDKEAILSVGEEMQTYKVGEAIKEGEYIAVCNSHTYAGDIKITKDGKSDADECINNDVFYVSTIFKVRNGEYIGMKFANIYPINSVFKTPMQGDAYLPGMFKVGVNIPAGEYLAIGEYVSGSVYREPYIKSEEEICYFSVDNTWILTVQEGQYLRTDACMLYPIEKAPSFIKAQKTFGLGMYKVGETIPAGTYTARTAQELGKILIYKDSLNTDDSMISMIYVEPEIEVTLIEGQYVDVQYAELSLSLGGSIGSVAIIEKGPDIVFDENVKPIAAASESEEVNYKVGKDIQPGEYMAIEDDGNIYVEVTDDSGDILYNGGNNCTIFKLSLGENLLFKNCKIYDINHVPSIPKKGEGYLTGRYKVGTHMPAGEYMAVGKSIYVDVYSDDSWDYDSQVGDLTNSNYGIITLQSGQYLELAGDVILYPIDLAPPLETLDGFFKSGMYKVGTHLPAGTYECSAVGTDGYVVISKDSKNERNSEISSIKIQEKEEITVTNGQYITVYGAALRLKEKKEENNKV